MVIGPGNTLEDFPAFIGVRGRTAEYGDSHSLNGITLG